MTDFQFSVTCHFNLLFRQLTVASEAMTAVAIYGERQQDMGQIESDQGKC